MGEMMGRDIVQGEKPSQGFWFKTSYSLNIYEISLLSPSRMSQPKHTAILRGDVLQDVATGQLFKLHPSEEEMQRGVWEYNAEADGHRWNYVVIEGTTYAINGCFIDWEEEEVKEWDANLMGQWPFGNRLTEAEVFMREVEDVLYRLDYYLEGELE